VRTRTDLIGAVDSERTPLSAQLLGQTASFEWFSDVVDVPEWTNHLVYEVSWLPGPFLLYSLSNQAVPQMSR